MSALSTVLPGPSRLAAANAAAGPAAAEQKRIAHATVDVVKFGALAGQLALLLAVFAVLRVDEGGFLRMAAASFGAFLVHYWLPFRWKEPFWIAASMAGAALLVGPVVAGLIVAIGLVFFGIIALPVAFRIRLTLILALSAVLV